jgi:hypothetical protein
VLVSVTVVGDSPLVIWDDGDGRHSHEGRYGGDVDLGFLLGRSVTHIGVSYQFVLSVPRDDNVVAIQLTAFTFCDRNGTSHDLDADQDRLSLGVALTLFERQITQAAVERGGRLLLRFDDGSEVSAPPLAGYEAWQISGPGRALIVCAPGGHLAVWTDTHVA